jgi:hypothetical protein
MTLHHARESQALRHAVILLDRPIVGPDGPRGAERVPATVRLKATVIGGAPVDCSIEIGAVRSAAGVEHPTWSDLQRAWQTLATIVHAKIRAGAFVDAGRRASVRVGQDDVMRDPAAGSTTQDA